ncbi:MAG: HEAT repeat domain-containing protein [Planctomycetaceae bacterium]|nr:HEAT repeat domain-containing protein [Planctomycetaceae bacterium]
MRNFLTFCGLCLIIASASLTVNAEPNQPSSTTPTSNQLADNWNDFLHYTVLGRYDLAGGFAQKVIDSNPDPLALLKLSEDNPKGYAILVKVHANNPQLSPLAAKILDIIEQGRYQRRTASDIIVEEIKRLSSTVRGKYTAIERLRNSGEYAIPYMLSAMTDESRKEEFPNIASALSEIGRPAVRPLAASLEMENPAIKAEVIRALGKIGYSEALGYLKYIVENDKSQQLRELAADSLKQIDAAIADKKAAELFFQTANNYYYKADSLMPVTEGNTANVWFWSKESSGLIREAVSKTNFTELMTMRSCEWALRADKDFGQAISLWLACAFRIDSTHIPYPAYFGTGHADAMTYAVTTGPEYLHEALERAIKDSDTVVVFGAVEALARNAGEKSLMFRYKTSQPLIQALSYNDKAVKYTAAIAVALAEPTEKFPESEYVIKNLAAAITDTAGENWSAEQNDSYAIRAAQALLKLAETKNAAVDVSAALDALVKTTGDSRDEMKIIACQILAYLSSPDAQRAIAELALKEGNAVEIRIAGFESLAVSAKVNANQLPDGQIDQIYNLVASRDANEQLRSAAAGAFGALNLPSRKVKDLILDQSKI